MALTPKLTALFAAGVLAAFAAGAASAAGMQWPARKASLLDVPQKRNDCAA